MGEKALAAEYQQRNRGSVGLVMLHHQPIPSAGKPATPRAHFRVASNDGLENAEKNRGSMKFIMSTDMNKDYASPRPAPKNPSREGREIASKHHGDIMGAILTRGPGGGGYMEERPASRLRGDGFQVAEKNNGKMHKVMNSAAYPDSGRPGSRLNGEGVEIAAKNRGTMGAVLNVDGNRGYSSPCGAPRVKPEGAEYADKAKGAIMSKVLDADANRGYNSPHPAPRIKLEAKENVEKSRGLVTKVFDLDGNRNYSSPRPGPRVSMDGADVAAHARGRMDVVFGAKSVPPSPAGAAPRVKPEGEESATKNRGTLTNIYYNYGHLPLSSRPAPKVKGSGEENYNASRGRMMDRLLSTTDQPASARPPARIKGEGARYMRANRGQVGSLFNPGKSYKCKPEW